MDPSNSTPPTLPRKPPTVHTPRLVVISTFSQPTLLIEAIESVRGQTCPHRDIIVDDDGSTGDQSKTAR